MSFSAKWQSLLVNSTKMSFRCNFFCSSVY
nr:MAG TPA: hypothetical protein [Caudoviricetes sp.]